MEEYNVPTNVRKVSNRYWTNKNLLRGIKFARLATKYNTDGVIALSEVRRATWFIAGSDERDQCREVQTLISLLVDYFVKDPAELLVEDELNEGGSSDE